jgi:hypothetical protein
MSLVWKLQNGIRVLAGTKNSRPVGFYSRNSTKSTVKPQHNNPTNMTTMVVPFAPHTTWDLWIRLIGCADPLPKGSGGGVV